MNKSTKIMLKTLFFHRSPSLQIILLSSLPDFLYPIFAYNAIINIKEYLQYRVVLAFCQSLIRLIIRFQCYPFCISLNFHAPSSPHSQFPILMGLIQLNPF